MPRPLNRTGHSGGKGSLRQRCLSIRFQIQLAYQPGPSGRFKIDEAGEVGRGSTERLDAERGETLDHVGAQQNFVDGVIELFADGRVYAGGRQYPEPSGNLEAGAHGFGDGRQMAANASWSRNEPSRPKFRCQGTPRL